MHRRAARRFLLGMVVAVSVIVSSPAPADAISCAPAPTLTDQIEDADWVFTGRQTVRWFWQTWSDGPNDRIVQVAVMEVYKGTVPSFVEVELDYQNASIDSLGAGRTGFIASPGSDAMVHADDCGGLADASQLADHFARSPTLSVIVPYLWRPTWALMVALLAIGGGLQWYPPEDVNEALGLD